MLSSTLRRVVLSLVALWLLAAVGVSYGPLLFSRGLVGHYFNGTEWSGAAVLTDLEHVGRGDWLDSHAPRFRGEPFSVTWRGWLAVETPNTFDFAVTSDGHAWLYLDDTEVVDGDAAPHDGARRGRMALSAGLHPVRIDFKTGTGARLEVQWARAGNPAHDIGQLVLYPSRTAYYLNTLWRPGTMLAGLASFGLLAGLTGWALRSVSRHLDASAAEPWARAWLWRVLALAAVLLAWQIWFGLPERWEIDELLAHDVVPGAQRGFAGGWYDLYPMLYFAGLSVLSWPFMFGATVGALDLWSDPAMLAQVALYRAATALCGVAVVYLAYRCAFEAFANRQAALWAAFLCAVMPLIVYLGKFAKPDLPYASAFLVSLLCYLQALRTPDLATYQRFAFAGMLAICLKDQAYGFFVLPALHLVVLRARAGSGGLGRRLSALVLDPPLVRAALVAVVTFTLGHHVLFNPDGFVAHLGLIAGGGSTGFRTYDRTVTGHAAMFVDALAQVPWILGWPAAVMVALGLPLAWRARREAVITLLLPIASYYATFISVVLYQYDRFYLAPAVILAMPAGLAMAWLMARQTAWARGVVAAVALYSLAQGVSVNLMMARDSRFSVESWLRDNVREGEVVGLAGPRAYLPRPGRLPSTDVQLDWAEVDAAPPEYLVVNMEHARRPRDRAFFLPLLEGTHATYRPVATFKSSPGLAMLAYRDIFRNGEEDPFTNLDKINPEIRVFARRDIALQD